MLLLVETTELIRRGFGSGGFSVTRNAFIVFTSNILPSSACVDVFMLVGALGYFRYLKIGLSFVLAFVGVKMLLAPHGPEPKGFQVEIPTGVSLMVVAAILLISVALSVTAAEREKKPRRE